MTTVLIRTNKSWTYSVATASKTRQGDVQECTLLVMMIGHHLLIFGNNIYCHCSCHVYSITPQVYLRFVQRVSGNPVVVGECSGMNVELARARSELPGKGESEWWLIADCSTLPVEEPLSPPGSHRSGSHRNLVYWKRQQKKGKRKQKAKVFLHC